MLKTCTVAITRRASAQDFHSLERSVNKESMEGNESKILIFGGTGYIGRHIVMASIKFGHPTYVYSRPNSTKTELLNEFRSLGANVVKGELDEHEKLVSVLKQVDVVISALALPQVLDQVKIIEAIRVAGNIKRFLPAEFGAEEDKVTALPPFEAIFDKKRKIRRTIESAGIPYTFVSANACAAYFVNYLLHPHDQSRQDINVYGSGNGKVVLNYEEDIGIYTIRVANDPRACNRLVCYRPPANSISQLELISLWERKTGRVFEKIHVSEEELVALSQTLPHPKNIPAAILHGIFVKGVTTNFDLGDEVLEASTLYPDLHFNTVEEVLDIFLKNPPKPYLTPFE